MEGWVKIHRKLLEKAFYSKDSEKVHLWIHLLLKANHSGREENLGGKPIACLPGQFTTGRKQLSTETGISESKIERILTYFEKIEQQIEQRKTSVNRLISISNWNFYQQSEQQNEQQVNNDRTTSEQRVNNDRTHYKNDKNENNDENEKIEEIYSLYPARCKNRNASTGKTSKDKKKIEKLIKEKGFENVKRTIEIYLSDCEQSKTYLKNFSVFLNNFPDIEIKDEKKDPEIKKQNSKSESQLSFEEIYRQNLKK